MLFSEIFGGGEARLQLSDPDDVLVSDVEIYAAPPGKVIKSLSLLSGGEKSMVALSNLSCDTTAQTDTVLYA